MSTVVGPRRGMSRQTQYVAENVQRILVFSEMSGTAAIPAPLINTSGRARKLSEMSTTNGVSLFSSPRLESVLGMYRTNTGTRSFIPLGG